MLLLLFLSSRRFRNNLSQCPSKVRILLWKMCFQEALTVGKILLARQGVVLNICQFVPTVAFSLASDLF